MEEELQWNIIKQPEFKRGRGGGREERIKSEDVERTFR